MNIFILSWCVQECAEWHFDMHVVKMIVELAQLLCTAHWQLNRPEKNERRFAKKLIYRETHKNHPCALWVRAHINNYRFTVKLAKALCQEYYFRYGQDKNKRHKTETVIDFLSRHEPKYTRNDNLVLIGPHKVTKPAQAMFDVYRVENDAISAYRKYYQSNEKQHLCNWKKRDKPHWFHNNTCGK